MAAYRFQQTSRFRVRQPGETVKDFYLATESVFEAFLKDPARHNELRNCFLRDRLIVGLNEPRLQKYLVASSKCVSTTASVLLESLIRWCARSSWFQDLRLASPPRKTPASNPLGSHVAQSPAPSWRSLAASPPGSLQGSCATATIPVIAAVRPAGNFPCASETAAPSMPASGGRLASSPLVGTHERLPTAAIVKPALCDSKEGTTPPRCRDPWNHLHDHLYGMAAYRFQQTSRFRVRQPGETVKDFYLATESVFEAFLKDPARHNELRNCFLRDRLIVGLNEPRLQKYLVASSKCVSTTASVLLESLIRWCARSSWFQDLRLASPPRKTPASNPLGSHVAQSPAPSWRSLAASPPGSLQGSCTTIPVIAAVRPAGNFPCASETVAPSMPASGGLLVSSPLVGTHDRLPTAAIVKPALSDSKEATTPPRCLDTSNGPGDPNCNLGEEYHKKSAPRAKLSAVASLTNAQRTVLSTNTPCSERLPQAPTGPSPDVPEAVKQPPALAISDEDTLRIFSHLTSRELLGAVRGACRRWRCLAVHERVWRWRTLSLSLSDSPDFVRLALEAVPRVSALRCFSVGEIVAQPSLAQPTLLKAAGGSRCTAVSLTIRNFCNPAHLIRLLRSQSGVIETLDIELPKVAGSVQPVLRIINNLHTLKELSLWNLLWIETSGKRIDTKFNAPRPVNGSAPSPPRLRRLTFYGPTPRSFVFNLVNMYASSLEHLDLGCSAMPTGIQAALTSCPELRRVQMDAHTNLLPLRDCAKLENLTVRFASAIDPNRGVKVYFGSDAACRLTVLRLKPLFSPEDAKVRKGLLWCLRAMAKSKNDFALTSLSIEINIGGTEVREVVEALKRMPALRVLELTALPHRRDLRLLTAGLPKKDLILKVCGTRSCAAPPLLLAVLCNPLLHASGECCEHFRTALRGRLGFRHPSSVACQLCPTLPEDTFWVSMVDISQIPTCCLSSYFVQTVGPKYTPGE